MSGEIEVNHRDAIIEKYMEWAPEYNFHGGLDNFLAHAQIDVDVFYENFESIKALESHIWVVLFEASVSTIENTPNYASFTFKEQLLSFLYTFIENCTLNREYLILHLDQYKPLLKIHPVWHDFHELYVAWITRTYAAHQQKTIIDLPKEINRVTKRGISELFWVKLVFIVDFWRHDDSPELEKTDVAIEKTVQALVETIEMSAVKSVLDLGKFVWQERFRN